MHFISEIISILPRIMVIITHGQDILNSLPVENKSPETKYNESHSNWLESHQVLRCGKFMDLGFAEDSLIKFMEELRGFVSADALNVIGFYQKLEDFTETFEDIAECITLSQPKNASLCNRFELTKYMFHTMSQAVHMLFYFRKKKSCASDLLCKVVHLNARLLAFLDDKGIPHTQLPKYRERLNRLLWTLAKWRKLFEFICDVLVMERLVFKSQSNQAREMLAFLERDLNEGTSKSTNVLGVLGQGWQV